MSNARRKAKAGESLAERERRVVEGGSIEEITEFYDNVDEGDLDWTPTESAAIERPELTQISVRIPKSDLDALKRRAADAGVGHTTLLRMIVHQHVHSPLTR